MAIGNSVTMENFYNWIGNGKSVVAHHEAGHAVAIWSFRLNILHISIMNEEGYVNREHYNQAKCLGVVSSQYREDYNLKRLLESKSGIVNRDGSITPFIECYAENIKKYAKREILISLAGPVSEVTYGGGDIFNKACSFSRNKAGSDREVVEKMLDLYCETDKTENRTDVLRNMIKQTELFVMENWDKIRRIAEVLEREYVIKGDRIDSIIGFNHLERIIPIGRDDAGIKLA
ncbi:peptidase M41 family protein [Citrobacter freundii]